MGAVSFIHATGLLEMVTVRSGQVISEQSLEDLDKVRR